MYPTIETTVCESIDKLLHVIFQLYKESEKEGLKMN